MMNSILVTGGAGFIGSHLVDRLLTEGWKVTVLDNFDFFYDKNIKLQNISSHVQHKNYSLIEADIRDADLLDKKLTGQFDVIVHLAAKAGVRPSIADPVLYQDVNVKGTQNMLEFAKQKKIKQFVFASSSSVYGINENVPWSENDFVLQPISPYASTKVSGELLGHVYSHLYGIRFLGLRFFTVYGPRQRPDLAIHKFSKLILEETKIPVFGDGSTRRDYTFVSDTVQGIIGAINYSASDFEIVNLGNNKTVSLTEMIETIEKSLQKKAIIDRQPEQPGDVRQTWADISKAKKIFGYKPDHDFAEGINIFSEWLLFHQKEKMKSIT